MHANPAAASEHVGVAPSSPAPASHWNALHAQPRFRPRYPDDLLVRWTLRHFPDRAGRRALDLGCGAGRHAAFLAHEGFETHAVDLSAVGVAETELRVREEGLAVQTQVCPAHGFEAPDGSFDAVVSYGVVCYAPPDEIAETFARVARALAPGGRFFCMTRSDRDWRRHYLEGGRDGPPRLRGMAETPAAAEEGQRMTLLDEPTLRSFLAPFAEVSLDRRTVSWWNGAFVDDDWLVSARV